MPFIESFSSLKVYVSFCVLKSNGDLPGGDTLVLSAEEV